MCFFQINFILICSPLGNRDLIWYFDTLLLSVVPQELPASYKHGYNLDFV